MNSYNYSSSSWDNTPQPNKNQSLHGMDPRRHRASTAPPGSRPPPPNLPPSHPGSFISQYLPPTIHRSDLFFANRTPQMNAGHGFNGPPVSSTPPHLPPHPYHHVHHTNSLPPLPPPVPNSAPLFPQGPHIHRSMTSPPIPPKPIPISHPPVLPKLPPKIPLSPQPPPQSTTFLPPRIPEEDGDEMAVALALSQTESVKGKDLQKLASQEEEDLARALEESIISAGKPTDPAPVQSIPTASNVQPGPSKYPTASAPTPGPSYSQPDPLPPTASLAGIVADIRRNDSWRVTTISGSQLSDDEAFARRLAAEEEEGEQRPSTVSDPSSKGIEAPAENSASANEPADPLQTARRNSTQYDTLAAPAAPNSAMSISEDEAYARKLAAEEEEGQQSASTVLPKTDDDARPESPIPSAEPSDLPQYSPRRNSSHESNSSTLASGSAARISDEEYARRLAAEETTSADETQTVVSVTGSASASPSISTSELSDLPRYGDANAKPVRPPNASQAAAPSATKTPVPAEPASLQRSSSGSSASNSRSSDTQALPGRPGPPGPTPSNNDTSLTGSMSVNSPYLHPERGFLKPTDSLRPPASVSSVSLSSPRETNRNEKPSPTLASPNQFIDENLLRGVSIDFAPPSLSAQLTPLKGALPNIISLPYGRCPPLHLQAPSWRHLLKLMARLSGTRIEPTVEALAVAKSDPLLRTVIQFVKPRHASPDWRAIIWLTLDHPVPASMPGAVKYTNGDVNVLPWSYTLSSLPTLLRDGADSPLSKVYTVPSTESTPYPVLPISFPNMAMYLQAALEESRRYANDSSSGIRRLARMVDMCYPSAHEDDEPDAAESSTVGGLFKRVMARANMSGSRKPRGRNEDTYELVTPFVPDEWG